MLVCFFCENNRKVHLPKILRYKHIRYTHKYYRTIYVIFFQAKVTVSIVLVPNMKASFVVSALILVSTILAVASFPVENSAEAASAPSTPSWLDCEICKVSHHHSAKTMKCNKCLEACPPKFSPRDFGGG